jgi:PKD repeat protein
VISAISIYRGDRFPSEYNGSIFFGDYAQKWIKVMHKNDDGEPDPTNITTFIQAGAYVVDLSVTPDGNLIYANYDGTIHKITYFGANSPPVAIISANATSGSSPFNIMLSALNSYDIDQNNTISYAWDLDGNGIYTDSSLAELNYTFESSGTFTIGLKVTDNYLSSSFASVQINVNNFPPIAYIDSPSLSLAFEVEEVIGFSGHALDPDSGVLDKNALSWKMIIHHCHIDDASDCHEHVQEEFSGIDAGNFTVPNHEFPSYLEIKLTATEPNSPMLTDTKNISIYPKNKTLEIDSIPSGIPITIFSDMHISPFQVISILNSETSVSAQPFVELNTIGYYFSNWSDGKEITHLIRINESLSSLTAYYDREPQIIFVSLSSNNSNSSSAKPGDIIYVNFTSDETIAANASILGHLVLMNSIGTDFTASYLASENDPSGIINFTIDYADLSGHPGKKTVNTTDFSLVMFSDNANISVVLPPAVQTPPPIESSSSGASSSSGNRRTAGGSGSGIIICSEKWTCSEWNECSDTNSQDRKCTDSNKCNTFFLMPQLNRSCNFVVPSVQDLNLSEDIVNISNDPGNVVFQEKTSDDTLTKVQENKITGNLLQELSKQSLDVKNTIIILSGTAIIGLVALYLIRKMN